ncbi:DUF2946 domain-containing protein [Massilia sp. IC2-278]|uniref:DUF2946 domain-containing protein n=1 Tax=Massilia sp. IC2-278 TaxID=2887200 RepID=UPI001E5C3C49|nr:DUF2946 domain-containing protein [Massilia sp. IC2-278]MCC2962151.1 DUF2946 domain-containing protein [Massilia sp. IC2-278]
MHRITRHWTAYAWIAALAILFNALAPVVSQSLSLASSTARQVEICTAMGIEMVPMADGASSSAPSSDALLKGLMHCAYCAPHAGAFALPPPAATVAAVVTGHDAYPPLFYRAPQPLFGWLSAQPRAPPALA